jgi:CTP synthase
MQMAVLDAAQSLAGIEDAMSSEFDRENGTHVVGIMTEWLKGNQLEKRAADGDLGGTMRLGAYPHPLKPGSLIARIYGSTEVSERHRHRYEVNIAYQGAARGSRPGVLRHLARRLLPETIEYPEDVHPWFIGVQYHPELKSRPLEPHPLFASFIEAALEQSRLV